MSEQAQSINKATAGVVWGWKALDPEFDEAVQNIAGHLLPGGFDVADDAPQTFEELKDHLDAGKRLKVWSGASGMTIYGSQQVNFAFRAWHDLRHYTGNFGFSMEGEFCVALAQVGDLQKFYGNHPRLKDWEMFVFAEITGQALYAHYHNGQFPNNQRLFVKSFLQVLTEKDADVVRM